MTCLIFDIMFVEKIPCLFQKIVCLFVLEKNLSRIKHFFVYIYINIFYKIVFLYVTLHLHFKSTDIAYLKAFIFLLCYNV